MEFFEAYLDAKLKRLDGQLRSLAVLIGTLSSSSSDTVTNSAADPVGAPTAAQKIWINTTTGSLFFSNGANWVLFG